MRPTSTRLLRRGLLAVFVLVAGAVAWSLRRPPPVSAPAPSAPAATTKGTTVGDLTFFRFREGKQRVEIQARAMTGQQGSAMKLQGVTVTFPFEAEGKASTATITADECVYEAERQRARFRGHVHVVTSDGFELETESLDYVGEKGIARSEDDGRFRRGTASGSAHGFEYRSRGEVLELRSNVRLRFEEEAGPPTDIEAGWAQARRGEGRVRFERGVTVHQGTRELRAKVLQLSMVDEFRTIERAAAIDDVDVRTVGPQVLPGAPPTAGAGEKRLRCRRLNVAFRAKGVLGEASAVGGASLETLPGPREAREKRRIEAQQLLFQFDEQGRLSSLTGVPAGAPRPTVLTADPLPPAGGGQRRVQSRRFVAELDPETGEVRSADFDGGVVFTEPGRKASAANARFEDGPGLIHLTGGTPRIVDEVQGSDLRAQRIDLGTRTQNVSASENVRHTLERRAKGTRSGVLAGDEPTVLLCRQFDYDAATKTARYRENALMRSGLDEIRAPLIVLKEPVPDRRTLAASDGVASLLHPRPGPDATKEPVPVEARSRELLYEEWTNRIVYTGDVEIRQGDIHTKSPRAEVTLSADGQAVERLVAGEPVEVNQGLRHATGRQGTYTPQNETFVLVGDKVAMEDADRHVEGRVLIFQVGNDRIRVDGQEEVRTEAVFKRKEPPKP